MLCSRTYGDTVRTLDRREDSLTYRSLSVSRSPILVSCNRTAIPWSSLGRSRSCPVIY